MFYIQRKDQRNLETVDEFETIIEAKVMCLEYQSCDMVAIYYISKRACKHWEQ